MLRVTDERLAALTDRLEQGVKEVYNSGQYKEYLAAMSKFHRYSYRNALLILSQFPGATRVAGYNTWKKAFDRQVKRGAQGIMIMAPCACQVEVTKTKRDPDTGQVVFGPDGQPMKETEYVSSTRYRVAWVFDISQTEGKELPQVGVSELTGDVPDFQAIYDRLAALCPLPVELGPVPGEAKGYTSFAEDKVVVKEGMSQMQTIKTLVHEIAHAKLHAPKTSEKGDGKGRGEREVEAESIAYVVCQHFGLDTSEYSFSYVAGWSRGKELDELKASLDVIHSTAGEIINAIQPPEPELTQEPQVRTAERKDHGQRRKPKHRRK